MAHKKGSNTLHIDQEILKAIDKKMQQEGFEWGRTKFCEKVLKGYAEGKMLSVEEVATEKLFLTMFGMGLIDQKKLDDVLALIRAGTLPATVRSDKFGIKVESYRDEEKQRP